MEEIRGTEALEQEILDDAHKRAERILRKAENDARVQQAQSEQHLQAAIAALQREYEEKKKAAEREMQSRQPLETMRLEIGYRDEVLRTTLSEALAALIQKKPRLFGQWCVQRLRRQADLIRQSHATIEVCGLDAESLQDIQALFAGVSNVSVSCFARRKFDHRRR